MQTPFIFAQDSSRRMNWRSIDKADIGRIVQGDLRDLNAVIEDLALVNLEEDSYVHTNPEVYRAIKVMQVGIQYLLHSKGQLESWCQSSYKAAQHEKKQRQSLESALKKQRAKIRKLQKEIDELDIRSTHYEMLSQVLKPESRPQPGKVRSSYPEEELKDSDFELSMSLADRKNVPEGKPHNRGPPMTIQEVMEPEEDKRISKFNNPSTGIMEYYKQTGPISDLVKKEGLVNSLSQEELDDEKLEENVALWENVRK